MTNPTFAHDLHILQSRTPKANKNTRSFPYVQMHFGIIF